MSEDPNTCILPLFDKRVDFAMKDRLCARRRLAEWQDREASRWAMLKMSRSLRASLPRGRVAVWRRGKGQGMKKEDARWHGLAAVVGTGKGWFWIELGGPLSKATANLVCFATPEEVKSTDVPGDEINNCGPGRGERRRARQGSRT